MITRLLARWWVRVVAFVLLSGLGYTLSQLPLMNFFFYFLVVLFPTMTIEKFRAGSRWSDIGLNRDRWMLRDLASGSVMAIGALALVVIAALLCGAQYRESVSYSAMQVFSIILLIITAAASEELAFRGVVYQALEERFSPLVAALLTSIAFSTAHFLNPSFSWMAFLNTFLAGMLFSAMYSLTKSLWLGIAFHATWNIALMLYVDSTYVQISTYQPLYSLSFIQLYASGFSPLWFGNEYGIEEGLITTLLLLSCAFLLPRLAEVSPYRASRLLRRSITESQLRNPSTPYPIHSAKEKSLP